MALSDHTQCMQVHSEGLQGVHWQKKVFQRETTWKPQQINAILSWNGQNHTEIVSPLDSAIYNLHFKTVVSEVSTAENTIMTSTPGRITWITFNRRYDCVTLIHWLLVEWRSKEAVRGLPEVKLYGGTKEVRADSTHRVRRISGKSSSLGIDARNTRSVQPTIQPD